MLAMMSMLPFSALPLSVLANAVFGVVSEFLEEVFRVGVRVPVSRVCCSW